MKKYFVKAGALMIACMGLAFVTIAQDSKDKLGEYDEIIIKKKGEKDTRVTVEIKDGVVTINGKPVSEFDDENVSVRKKKVVVKDVTGFTITGPECMQMGPGSPFREGAWNFSGDAGLMELNSNKAMLGVVSDKDAAGALIKEVSEESPAAKAGLKAGDIITKVDEIKIGSPDDLVAAIGKYKPEEKVTITYLRNKKTAKATATLAKRKPQAIAIAPGSRSFNFSERDIERMMPRWDMKPDAYNFNMHEERKPRLGIRAQETEDGKGVKVIGVDELSAASKAGILEGDIITNFDGVHISNTDTLAATARAAKDKSSFKVSVLRNGVAQELEIKIPKKLKTTNL